jgi:hypothetical protein
LLRPGMSVEPTINTKATAVAEHGHVIPAILAGRSSHPEE